MLALSVARFTVAPETPGALAQYLLDATQPRGAGHVFDQQHGFGHRHVVAGLAQDCGLRVGGHCRLGVHSSLFVGWVDARFVEFRKDCLTFPL